MLVPLDRSFSFRSLLMPSLPQADFEFAYDYPQRLAFMHMHGLSNINPWPVYILCQSAFCSDSCEGEGFPG